MVAAAAWWHYLLAALTLTARCWRAFATPRNSPVRSEIKPVARTPQPGGLAVIATS